MGKLNIFGREGLLTPVERQKPYEYNGRHVKITTTVDLYGGVKVECLYDQDVIDLSDYTADISAFIAEWTRDVLWSLNGFRGFDCIKFDTNDIIIEN